MPGNRIPSANWIRWVALAGVVALVLGVAASIVVLTADAAPGNADLVRARQVEERLVRLDALVGGTVSQQSAGAYLDYVARTAELKPCMAAEGERYRYPFVDPYAGRPEYTGVGGVWAEPLMSTSSSAFALFHARYQWVADKYSAFNPDENWDDQTASYRHAFSQCRHLSKGHPGHPRSYISVLSDLHWLTAELGDEFGPSSVYDSCMLEAGYDVYWDDFGGPDAMHMMVESQAPALDLSPESLVKSEEWAEYLEYEQEILEADYHCRVSKYVQLMDKLEAPLDEFESSHQSEIAQVQAEWQQIVADAESHGWTPPNDRPA